MKSVWVIFMKSESGDNYGPYVFDKEPTDDQLKDFLKEHCPGDFDDDEDGPGVFGSYLHIEESFQTEVYKLK